MNKLSIAISGSHGLVGSVLVPHLESEGHRIVRLARNPATNLIDPSPIEGCDAVIHLAGENIAGGRWTDARKKILRESRVENTRFLAETIRDQENPPKIFLSASATGFYGDRGDEILDEDSKAGKGFLSELTQAWEEACEPAKKAGIRVVNLRFGMILSPAGGALRKMLPIFKLGLGGPLGSGKQWISWVSMTDAIGAIRFLLEKPVKGPVNVVALNHLTNKEFTHALGAAIHRPAFFPAPALALKMALGEMAGELLLSSQRVIPKKLIDAGYVFRHPDMTVALVNLLT